MGLAIVRLLAELHEGTIACSSDGIGKGTKFDLCLPLWDSSKTQPPLDHSPSAASLSSGTSSCCVSPSPQTPCSRLSPSIFSLPSVSSLSQRPPSAVSSSTMSTFTSLSFAFSSLLHLPSLPFSSSSSQPASSYSLLSQSSSTSPCLPPTATLPLKPSAIDLLVESTLIASSTIPEPASACLGDSRNSTQCKMVLSRPMSHRSMSSTRSSFVSTPTDEYLCSSASSLASSRHLLDLPCLPAIAPPEFSFSSSTSTAIPSLPVSLPPLPALSSPILSSLPQLPPLPSPMPTAASSSATRPTLSLQVPPSPSLTPTMLPSTRSASSLARWINLPVLIVEDSTPSLKVLERSLRSFGFNHIETAQSVKEAFHKLHFLKSEVPDSDASQPRALLISDIGLCQEKRVILAGISFVFCFVCWGFCFQDYLTLACLVLTL